MPGKVGVKIKAARNLPVMDKGNDTTDAYVEIKLGGVTHKTDVCRKSLNPIWNTEWFRFEIDDADLQDEPLQIRLMDYDTYSANDAIGKVNINLNPLCLDTANQTISSKANVMSGWIPVFDTIHGIRGEINIIVKVDLFSDLNKFRQSSCGIPFFHSQCIPHGYKAQMVNGFVEELIVNDDPEYQWIDKIRTPRASNEVRQLAFLKLSGQVQRKMGLKAINLGGNAVIGYTQCFDLEGDVGVVARGIGTAVTLIKDTSCSQPPSADPALIEEVNELQSPATATTTASPLTSTIECASSLPEGSPALKRLVAHNNSARRKISPSSLRNGTAGSSTGDSASTSTTASAATTILNKDSGDSCRRSSDSDLSTAARGNSICVASERLAAATAMMKVTQSSASSKSTHLENMEMMEYPFLTMTKYPPGFIQHFGATVAARSVKLLERVPNPDEPELRDSWWIEIRMEIRSHARSLGCNVVLGYTESTSISDDVCVLSATGTAAVISMAFHLSISQCDLGMRTPGLSGSLEDRETSNSNSDSFKESSAIIQASQPMRKTGLPPLPTQRNNCTLCHVPYNPNSMSFAVKMRRCAICRKGRVPDVLLVTLEVPEQLQITGRGCFMQAQVVRAKKDLRSEMNAREISDAMPFLEYELHRMLINKLKAKGMNSIFGLKTQMAIGDKMIALVATGTALYLTALPSPQMPKIVAGNSWTDNQRLNELQKKLQDTFERNREIYQLKSADPDQTRADKHSDTDESEDEEANEIDFNCGNKQLCVLEVDEIEDMEIISLLMEPYPPEGFHVVNTQQVPGLPEIDSALRIQMFSQVWRARLEPNSGGFSKHFQRLLQTIYFKLRTLMPCAICDLRFRLDLPENDQLQLLVTGMALGLPDANRIKYKCRAKNNGQSETFHTPINAACEQIDTHYNSKRTLQDEDYILPLDEDQMVNTPTPTSNIPPFGLSSFKIRKASPTRMGAKLSSKFRPLPMRDYNRIDITPLSFMPARVIDKYLGNLKFFFIRESTSIRELGGISGFVHSFITELLAIVRAHISAIGGNAMVSFYMTELMLTDNQHKNQGQCLISIGGDAVHVSINDDD